MECRYNCIADGKTLILYSRGHERLTSSLLQYKNHPKKCQMHVVIAVKKATTVASPCVTAKKILISILTFYPHVTITGYHFIEDFFSHGGIK